MLECFPGDKKRSDGRLLLPLHLAVSVSSSRLEDIHTLFTADPAAIKSNAYDETNKLNPFHLAVMRKNPRMEIIEQLQIYFPGFGSSDSDQNTPLHLAARYADIVIVVMRELLHMHLK